MKHSVYGIFTVVIANGVINIQIACSWWRSI